MFVFVNPPLTSVFSLGTESEKSDLFWLPDYSRTVNELKWNRQFKTIQALQLKGQEDFGI